MKKLLILLFILTFKLSFSQTNLDYLLFIKINEYRIENGVKAWKWDNFIWGIANKHTQYQVKSNYMGHREVVDVSNHNEVYRVLDRFKEKNVYDYYTITQTITVAENVLVILPENKPIVILAETMLQMWINSPPHNQTLLNPKYMYGSISCLTGTKWKDTPGNWIYSTLNVVYYK